MSTTMEYQRDFDQCKRGHVITSETLYVSPSGGRYCRTCKKDSSDSVTAVAQSLRAAEELRKALHVWIPDTVPPYQIGLEVKHHNRSVEITPRRWYNFWTKVDFGEGVNGCWLWTGARTGGYGVFGFDGGTVVAHRAAFYLCVGPIDQGLELDHLCRVRRCVNPEHLEPVTRRENLRRSPLALPAKNALKTECKHGHAFTEENTYIGKNGRNCRKCHAIRELARYQPKPPKTVCKNGHAFNEANTQIRRDGSRACRTCRRASINRWKNNPPAEGWLA